jgi:hypothetical protein
MIREAVTHPVNVSELDRLFIKHPAFEDVIDRLLFEFSVRDQVDEPPNFYVTGPSGIGKTTMIKHLSALFPRSKGTRRIPDTRGREVICDHIPMLHISMPTQPTSNSVIKRFLYRIGDPNGSRGDRDELFERLVKFIPVCGVDIILIDEAQRAVDRDGVLRRYDIAEVLKDLHERTKVTICLFGMGRVTHLFDHDEQIARRWEDEIPIPPYDWGSLADSEVEPESRLCFIALLVEYRDQVPIPFAAEVDVESDNIALRFFYVSRGVLGLLKKLVLAAIKQAMRRNESEITLLILSRAFKEAFHKMRNEEGLIDPFGPDWDGRLPPPLIDHTKLLKSAKPRGKKSDRRSAINTALSKL